MSDRTLAGDISRRLMLVAAVILVIQLILMSSEIMSNQELMETHFSEAHDVLDNVVWEDGHPKSVTMTDDLESLIEEGPGITSFEVFDETGKVWVSYKPELLGPRAWELGNLPEFWITIATADAVPAKQIGLHRVEDGNQVWLRLQVPDHTEEQKLMIALAEMVEHAGALVVFVGLCLGIGIISIRHALRPLQSMAEAAAELDPRHPEARLKPDGLPKEVAPFVVTINQAFSRIRKVLETQRAFTAAAAHELRTPLAVLTLSLDKSEAPNKDQLKADVSQMSSTVGQLLALARLDADDLQLEETVDLSVLTKEVVTKMVPFVYSNGYEVEYVAGDGAVIDGNRDAIEAALTNLIENAVRHTPKGTRIQVSVGPGARVVIEDSGPGLPEGDEQRLFQPFQRGKKAGKGGTGLGLAIVKRIAEAHGGGVKTARSELGGAAFFVDLGPRL